MESALTDLFSPCNGESGVRSLGLSSAGREEGVGYRGHRAEQSRWEAPRD